MQTTASGMEVAPFPTLLASEKMLEGHQAGDQLQDGCDQSRKTLIAVLA
jgi:hypothetical protein